MTTGAASGDQDLDGPGDDGFEDLDDLAYGDAVAELESILAAIEDDEIDIDHLARQVRRAAALIRLCQTRIAGARIEVERVVADLAAGLDPPARDGASDPTASSALDDGRDGAADDRGDGAADDLDLDEDEDEDDGG